MTHPSVCTTDSTIVRVVFDQHADCFFANEHVLHFSAIVNSYKLYRKLAKAEISTLAKIVVGLINEKGQNL